MPNGAPVEDIDRAIEYCATFDAEFPSRVRGATSATMAAIEAALGRPSSAEHRRFVERLGVDAAWLDFSPHHVDAQTILYAHQRTEGPMPQGYELFGISDDEPFQDLYLVGGAGERRLALLNTRDGCSYKNLAGESGMPVAGSITEYICLLALYQKVIQKRPWQAVLGPGDNSSRPALDPFAAIVSRFGFEPLWFSSPVLSAMTVNDNLIMARQAPDYPVVVTLAAADETLFRAALAALTEGMQLRRSR